MNMNRRQILGTAGLAMGALLSPNIFSSSQAYAAEKKDKGPSKGSGMNEIAKTAAACQRTGELCLAHCQRELAKGNTSMAKCSEQVHQMLAMTKAMLSLAAQNSPLAPKLAALCAQACKSCADACAEHKEHFAHGMHLECRDCMEDCLACEKACNSMTA